jgi:cytochrome P450
VNRNGSKKQEKDICLDWQGQTADPKTIGDIILSPGGPRVVKARNSGNSSDTYFVARCEDVAAILRNPSHFDLSLYDTSLDASTKDVRFFLGVDSKERDDRLAMLRAAQIHVSVVLRSGEPPNDADFLKWTSDIAAERSRQVLTSIFRDRKRGGSFNAVREYGYMVTYLCAARIFGIPGPDRMPKLVRMFMLARNFATQGRILRPRDDFAAATTILTLSHVIFGNLFGNATGTNATILAASRKASKAYNQILIQAIERGKADNPDSLLAGLFAVRDQFPHINTREYCKNMRSILFELIGAMTILVGTSFARLMEITSAPHSAVSGIEWSQLAQLMADPSATNIAIDECLRLNPTTTQLTRRVAQDSMIGTIRLPKDSIVHLLVAAACRDPRAYENPDIFAPSATREYLNFGPAGGPHACYGQHMARILLRNMVQELEKVAQPNSDFLNTSGQAMSIFAKLPDEMTWHFRDTLSPIMIMEKQPCADSMLEASNAAL